MLASELISKLQEIIEEEGDNPVFIDVPDRQYFEPDFDVEGKFYIGNVYRSKTNERIKRVFIIIPERTS